MSKEENKKETCPEVLWLNNKYKDSNCNHKWEYIGHGHNYNCYKCTKCGVEGDY